MQVEGTAAAADAAASAASAASFGKMMMNLFLGDFI
jgi:hypothetical protein